MQKTLRKKTFARSKSQRDAMFNAMAGSFILKEKIKTTQVKAKELQKRVEKVITKAKKNQGVAVRRLLLKSLPEKAVKKLLSEIGPKYKERNGGYTRLIKLMPRKSDGAKMAIIELV